LGGLAQAAAPVKLAFGTYSGYFVSNKFEPDAAESFLVITNQGQFDKVFGVAMVMGDKSHRLPKDAFKSNTVLAAIKRGAAVWEFKVEGATLAVVTRKGLVVITGCSHPGVIEFVKEAKRQLNEEVYMVCGGMHLLKHSDIEVKQTIAQLKEIGVRKVGPTHCTGDKAIALFKEAFGEQYAPMGVGRITDY